MASVFRSLVCFWLVLFSITSTAVSKDELLVRAEKVQDDSALVLAVMGKKKLSYLEASNLIATEILPDDTSGSRHQKWKAKLSNGSIVTIVYNSDMGERVPVTVGDKFDLAGEFIWIGKSGMMHWLHYDPLHRRPDGYVILSGEIYGLNEN